MRRDTKIAIVAAIVFVGLGGYFVLRGKMTSSSPEPKKDSTTAAKETTPSPTAAAQNTKKPTENLQVMRHTNATHSPTGTSSPLVQPTPIALGSPKPTDTPAPSGTITATPRPSAFSPSPSNLSTTTQPSATPIAAKPGDTPRPSLAPSISVDTHGAARPTPGSGEISLAGNGDKPPSAAKPVESTTEKKLTEGPKTHVVQAGETFTSLAVKYFGHAKYTNLITKANPTVDPRKVRIGMKVIIPPAPENMTAAASPAPAPGPGTPTATLAGTRSPSAGTPITRTAKAPPVPADRAYTIKAGEGWYTLAQRFLGNGERWTELYELNKERVPHNPHNVPPGTVIELPKEANMKAVTAAPTTKPAGTTTTEKTTTPKKATE